MVPHRTPFFLPLLFPNSLIWRYSSEQRDLYLTFDDGPVAGPTEFVLETLHRFGVKATFFCIGDNIRKNASVYSQILTNGHAAGNHTFNHLNGWKTEPQKYLQNIEQCESFLGADRVAGSRIFRPPYGRITRKQINVLSSWKIIMWDVLSIDYEKNLKPDKCLRNTIKATRPGSIVVFHDSFKAEKNLCYALPRYLEHCLEHGYSFKIIN